MDRTKRTRHHRNRGALRKQHPYLRLNRFQGVRSLTRKENSGSGFPQCFRVHLRYRAKFSRWAFISVSRYGNINPFPFRFIRWITPPFLYFILKNGTSQYLRIDWPTFNCCSRGTLLHFSLQGSHLNICYYHQDLHQWKLQPGLRPKSSTLTIATLLLVAARFPKKKKNTSHTTVEYKSPAQAPSIFRASWFGRWVVTHSLAVSNFHGHRPAVYINQRLSWGLMSGKFGTLTQRLVHPTAPVLLTKNGPLGVHIQCLCFIKNLSKQDVILIESLRIGWRRFVPQFL